jgi:glutathione S-transferase
MSDPIVFGFPYSTFVHIVRLILTHKGAAYTFRDLETEMGKPTHLALHPFNRVPVLQHDDFNVYETSAIVTYIDEVFEQPPLQPKNARDRARMHQWMSSVNSYYYTYMIYHVTHERLVFPRLGIASDEKVVAHALPKIDAGLQVMERELGHGKEYLLGSELTLTATVHLAGLRLDEVVVQAVMSHLELLSSAEP